MDDAGSRVVLAADPPTRRHEKCLDATAALGRRWTKGGPTLTLTDVSDADAASYKLIVSNLVGQAASAAATLVVLDPPRITRQPLNQTNIAGTTATFSATATGTAPLSYQWLRGKIALPQQRSSNLTLLKISDLDAASYSAVITNVAGSITSTPARLTIVDLPQLSAQRLGANALVSWPTGVASLTLEWTTNLASPAAWATNPTVPVIVNGQNTLTIPFSGAQRFFRLGN